MKPHPTYNPLARVPTDESPRSKAWEEACRIAEWIRVRHPTAKVQAFGSILRPGAWSPRSDIDLAVSGSPDLSWKIECEVQDAFPTYRVQVIDIDRILGGHKAGISLDEGDPETENFHEDVIKSGIELPAPFPASSGPSEILEIVKRLESTIRRADAEMQKLLRVAEVSHQEPDMEKADLLLDAVRWEAMRYRVHIERGLSRVLGYIDRLGFDPELDEGEERLRLYEIASRDIPGLRPPVIPQHIAAWHSKYVDLEFGLMDEADEKCLISAHIQELPAIHKETKSAFEAFGLFLSTNKFLR